MAPDSWQKDRVCYVSLGTFSRRVATLEARGGTAAREAAGTRGLGASPEPCVAPHNNFYEPNPARARLHARAYPPKDLHVGGHEERDRLGHERLRLRAREVVAELAVAVPVDEDGAAPVDGVPLAHLGAADGNRVDMSRLRRRVVARDEHRGGAERVFVLVSHLRDQVRHRGHVDGPLVLRLVLVHHVPHVVAHELRVRGGP